MFEIMYDDQVGTSYTATITLNIISIIDPIANASSIFFIPLFKRKTALVMGFFFAGIFNIAIGVCDVNEYKTGIIIFAAALTLVVGIA